MKSILYFLDYLHIGGATTFVNDYANFVNKHGYKSIIVTFEGDIVDQKEFLKTYFTHSQVLVLQNSRWSSKKNILYRLLFHIDLLASFSKIFRNLEKSIEIQAIHFNLTWSAMAVLLFCPGVYRYPRIITFYMDMALEHLSRTNSKSWKSIVLRLFLRVIQLISLHLCSTVIAFSQYSKELVSSRFYVPDYKIQLIPGIVNTKYYKPLRRYPIPEGKKKVFTLVNISRFEPRKGHIELLKSLRILLDKGIDVQLTISGPFTGDMYQILNMYEKLDLYDHVRFLHFSSPDRKLQLFSNSDLFIIPSIQLETFGMTVIEALACGVPVVGTPVGAIPEVLKLVDEKLITRDTSAKEIALAIIHYCNSATQYKQKLRQSCRQAVLQNFVDKKAYSHLISYYS